MKACKSFHFEDVEKGDRLYLRLDYEARASEGFTITVSSIIRGSRFGPRVIDVYGEEFYLDDFDVTENVTVMPSRGAWTSQDADSIIEDLAERLYKWSGGIFWKGETTWQDRHREEARQWVAYAELLHQVKALEAANKKRRDEEFPYGRDGLS